MVEGEVITFHNNLSDVDTLGTITYVLTHSVNGAVIEDDVSYTIPAGDVGGYYILTANYTDGLGQAETKTGLASATVTASGAPYTPPAGSGLLETDFEGTDADMSTVTNANGFYWESNNRTSVVTNSGDSSWCSYSGSTVVYNNAQICNIDQTPASGNWAAYEGDFSLRFRYPASTNTDAEQRFNMGTAEDDLWVRFWLQVPSNYSHPTYGSPNNSKIFALWMDGYSQNGQGPTVVWEIRSEADGVSSYIYFHYNMGGPTVLIDAPVGTFQTDEVINCSDGGTAILEQFGYTSGKYFLHFFETNDVGSWASGSTVTGATSGATANITTSKYRWPTGTGNAGGDKQETSFITVPDDRGKWMQIVIRVKAATSNTADDGIIDMWRRWDGESTFTKLHEFSSAITPAPYGGPAGWIRGYFMGATHGFNEDTEFLIDKVEFSTTTLV
jgi:hypothetical protein